MSALERGTTPSCERSVVHSQTKQGVSVLEGVCSLNEVRDPTPSVKRSVRHSRVARKGGVSSHDHLSSVIMDSRLTYGMGKRPKTLEDMGIDINLYKGAVYGCSTEELKRHIEGYWALPPEDRGKLRAQ